MNQAPWTDIGHLQNEMRDIQRQLHQKCDSTEFHSMYSKINYVERSIDNIENRLCQIEYDIQQLKLSNTTT